MVKTSKTVETKKEEKTDVNLDSLSLAELRDMAKEKEIKGYSTLKKAELIEKLK
ncbi:MAG: Rho termination factor N-terminal domain-containing protein [bacterium]|nr:Rho termination factor N-terminal domain-containing protein [bacterium]